MKTGALPVKALAAGKSGFEKMIIPSGQSKFLVYEKHIEQGLSDENHFIVKEYDLHEFMKSNYNLETIEITNLKDALNVLLA